MWHYILSQITSIQGFRQVGWGRRVDEHDTSFIIDEAGQFSILEDILTSYRLGIPERSL